MILKELLALCDEGDAMRWYGAGKRQGKSAVYKYPLPVL